MWSISTLIDLKYEQKGCTEVLEVHQKSFVGRALGELTTLPQTMASSHWQHPTGELRDVISAAVSSGLLMIVLLSCT